MFLNKDTRLIGLADRVGICALDVGARGGLNSDLSTISPAVDYYGFEPDTDECARLHNQEQKTWKSVTFVPLALGSSSGEIALNIYKKRGCTSKLAARPEMARLFSREDYYAHEGTIGIPVQRLDDVLVERGIDEPAFMKIDVQGMEVEVFSGSGKALDSSLVGIRVEVGFFPTYDGQPLFAEVDQALRPYGYVPMRWLELHEWRRLTRAKYPARKNGPLPVSRGQIIHGDVLYLLHPETLDEGTDANVRRLIRLGLIAACYGHLDHAHAAFARPRAREFIQDTTGRDPVDLLENVSQALAVRARWSMRFRKLQRAMKWLGNRNAG